MITLFQTPPATASDEENSWPDELRAAIAAYPRVPNAPGFEANFWRQLQARQSYARTFRGRLEHLAQVQIGGLCVWRLAGSTLAGAALPALGLALGLMLNAPTARAPITFDVPAFSALAWQQLQRQQSWKTPFKTQTVALWLDGQTGFNGGKTWSSAV